jgi:FAD/FMN-containing dehydrogenase
MASPAFERDARFGPLPAAPSPGILVNDVHSRLNATRVARRVPVQRTADAVSAIVAAARAGDGICIAGGQHAMGGQQFASGGVLLDTRTFNRVRAFDEARGLVEVDAGIQWPELVAWLLAAQRGRATQWGIRQKQTGADRLSIGGALSANVHGRGLAMRPFVGDVEAFTLVTADGGIVRCSREEHRELFALVIGGYGLFGFIDGVTLRLGVRHKVRREVEIATADTLMSRLAARLADGFEYGDFQFALDPCSDDFLHRGILSCYRPVPGDTPIPPDQHQLGADDWRRLVHLAHVDKQGAWDLYAGHYLRTDGHIYWSDLHQLSPYVDDYHTWLDREVRAECAATEVIAELYVPREALAGFLADAAADFRAHGVECIYGTVRLIERDDETRLPWARAAYACTVFNLHTRHTPAGLAHTAAAFRRLNDLALARGGSFYLTYHRDATREQLLRAYPALPDVLRAKRALDPSERFTSDWYRHVAAQVDDRAG